MKLRPRPMLIIFAVLLLVATGIYWLKNTRIHVHNSSGMITYNAVSNPLRPATEEQFAEAIRRLLAGKFDVLSVSRGNDPQSSVVLTTENRMLKLSAYPNTSREADKIKALKATLNRLHLRYEADDSGFSGGYTEEFRITMIEVDLPANDIPKSIQATRQILATLEPHLPENSLYLSADIFSKATSGIELQRIKDPLADLLE